MKHFTLFKTWLLAVVMLLVGAGGVWAEKVADYTQIVSGKSYRIGATVSSVDYYFVVSDAISASVQGGVTQNAADATPFKFVGNETSWTIQFMNDNFLSLKSSRDNGKVVVQSSSSTWTLSNNSSRIRMNVGDTYALQFNTSLKDRFGSYANTETDLWVEEIQSASDPYTVSFDAGTGTYEGGDIAEDSGGAGITLPAATGCGAWTFAGWATATVSETTDTPELLSAGDMYYPADDITLYAVYSMSEGGGATEATLTITEADFTGVSYADNNGDHVKASSTNEDITYNTNQIFQNSSAMQWQKNNGSLYNKTDLGSITKIEVIGSANYLTVREGSSADPTSGTTVTATGTDPYTYNLSGSNGFAHLKTGTLSMTTSVKFYYTKPSEITTYNSNPDCSVASILVSEDEFNFSAYVNQTADDIFEVEAFNLTADMSFALTGGDAAMFDYELADDFDAKEGGFVYVYYKPTAAGNHGAVLTISSTGADNVEIALSGVAIPQIAWANLQYPGSGTITLGGAYVIYGQVYHPGITDVSEDESEDIQAWAGYSTDNTDPNTWTNWVEASYNGQSGNNHEYKLDLGAEIDAPGTYYYAFRYKLGNAEYVYGGFDHSENTNGGFWGDDNESGALTINTDTSKDIGWGNVQWPLEGHIFIGEDFAVYGQVHKEGVTDQEGDINEGIKAWLGFTTDWTTNPANWDEGAWSAATFNEKHGNNYEFGFNIASAITSAGEYYYVYRYQYDNGAYYYGGTDNKAWNENDLNFGELTVDVLTAPVAQQPSGNLFKHVEANWSKVPGVDGYILSVYQKETVQAEVDHATNGSFETWTDGQPDGWYGDKSNIGTSNVKEYTESAQDGSKAVQLINATTSHKRFTTDVVTVQEDTKYTITFWARGKGEIRTAIFDDRSGTGFSIYNAYISVNSDEWVEYSQVITSTTNSDEAEFIFSLRNTVADNGHLQIDNVSITAELDVENILHVDGSPATLTDADNENENKQEFDPFIYTFTGLKRTTEYYYSVVAYKGELQSPASNEVFFVSGPRTDVEQAANSQAVYAYDAKVFVNTTAGESIEIFNVAGQKISTTIAHDGLNIIPVNYSGIVVVKVGDKVAKLSL